MCRKEMALLPKPAFVPLHKHIVHGESVMMRVQANFCCLDKGTFVSLALESGEKVCGKKYGNLGSQANASN